ncbi:YTH domain-containing protein ECT2-like isoform X3 [Zingiber officinale]|uniref:YTH domain-containing protein ECT2-like isoform X3 n=1 Tax=Zingiber officinale TaxID=94328 RepID=UPI001C4AE009|nr:YTH domain-containing protein ECT2-like isoform X3 [Zingiber officinale]
MFVMTATQQVPDRVDSIEPLSLSTMDTEQKPVDIDNSSRQKPVNVDIARKQSPSIKDEKVTTFDASHNPSNMYITKDMQGNLGSSDAIGDNNMVYPQVTFSPQAQYFYGGYENPAIDWEGHSHLLNLESLDVGQTGVYNENPSLVYPGYGYSPQMLYGSYSPVMTALPSISGDGQLYSTQQFQFSGAYYQQPSPTNISSATPISQADWTMPIDQQGSFPADTLNFNANLFTPTPGYHLSYNSSGGDWLRFSEGIGSATPLLSSVASPQAIATLCFGQSTMPFGLGSLQQKSSYGFGSSVGSLERGYPHGVHHSNGYGTSFTNSEIKDEGAVAVQKEYKDAKFFIIKSYTEDNVHKSIKYGVWASTSNGNRKLDSSYHEAKNKEDPCPVFFFFSVNASAQFCGVAEMIGPVDFEKSVDYWQQDKWNGQFPVKWHIVKDVANNLFRHITLENNDNKPVTNSRDTQEVKLEQGLEMLSIFKKHEYEASILDDFEFYEEREKAMQERKALQHRLSNSARPVPAAFGDDQRNPSSLINQFSKNFAHALRLEERGDADLSKDKNNSLSIGIAPKSDDMIKPATAIVTTSLGSVK